MSTDTKVCPEKARLRGRAHLFCGVAAILIVAAGAVLALLGSPYLAWETGTAPLAVVGKLCHGFEWIYWRVAPFLLFGAIVGLFLTKKQRRQP